MSKRSSSKRSLAEKRQEESQEKREPREGQLELSWRRPRR
jgi:hypothetical protein